MLKISAHEWFAGQNICPDIPDTGSVACISNVYGTCIIHHSHTSIRKRCLLSGFWGSSVVMTPPRSSRGSSRAPDSWVRCISTWTTYRYSSTGVECWSVVGSRYAYFYVHTSWSSYTPLEFLLHWCISTSTTVIFWKRWWFLSSCACADFWSVVHDSESSVWGDQLTAKRNQTLRLSSSFR